MVQPGIDRNRVNKESLKLGLSTRVLVGGGGAPAGGTREPAGAGGGAGGGRGVDGGGARVAGR